MSLEDELDDSAAYLKEAIDRAALVEAPEPRCSLCGVSAVYIALRKNNNEGPVTWVPICRNHATGWWAGATWVGKMYVIGTGVIAP